MAEILSILQNDMLHVAPTKHCLDNDFLSPTVPLTPLPPDAKPFSEVDPAAGAPPPLAPEEYSACFERPPLGIDRGDPGAGEMPSGWKPAEKKVVHFFTELDESVSTLDPASRVFQPRSPLTSPT